MGFDISHHPVDVDFIQSVVLPYILGDGDIDSWVEEAVQLSKVRWRANAWGLGVLSLQHKQSAKRRAPAKPKTAVAKGKPAPKRKPKPSLVPDKFDSDLHVWGRPFFITSETPDEVGTAIDRYIGCQPKQVDSLVEEMLGQLNPALVGKVTPDAEGKLPKDDVLRHSIRWKLDLLRECVRVRKGKKPVQVPNGEELDPKQALAANTALVVLEFAAAFRPGWMSRGHFWPTVFLKEAGVPVDAYFERPRKLFQPLLKVAPEVIGCLNETIGGNFEVGGYVPAERVVALRESLERHREKILAYYQKKKWGDVGVELTKLYEAVRDAESRGLAFAEAAEVYSGPMGIMN